MSEDEVTVCTATGQEQNELAAPKDFYTKINDAYLRGVEQNIIRELNLVLHKFDDRYAELLAERLKKNTSVLRLNLEFNDITDEGAVKLAESLCENQTLLEVNVANNRIGLAGLSALARGPMSRNRHIVSWNVSGNGVDARHTGRAEAEREIVRALWDHKSLLYYQGPGWEVIHNLVRENEDTIRDIANFVEGMDGAEA